MHDVSDDKPVKPTGDERVRLVADFLDPGRRSLATHELAALGAGAVPVVASVLEGETRNEFGVPYRAFGEALRCVLVTARLLGPLAISLEPAVASELESSDPAIRAEAAAALGALPALSELSVLRLATLLEDQPTPAMEAAVVIVRSNLTKRQSVLDIVDRSPRAARTLAQALAWVERGRR